MTPDSPSLFKDQISFTDLKVSWLKQLLSLETAGLALLFGFATQIKLPLLVAYLASAAAVLWTLSILATIVAFRELLSLHSQWMNLDRWYSQFAELSNGASRMESSIKSLREHYKEALVADLEHETAKTHEQLQELRAQLDEQTDRKSVV